jgi:uncharacterized protein (TIGR02453 family)
MKQQTEKFSGFTPETFNFLTGLAENNCKPWFEEHRLIYEEELLQPLRAFTLAMTPTMYAIDSQIDLRVNKIVSRIYRDTRFSHDKSPYKTCLWVTFQRLVQNWEGFPGYYLEIGKEGYQYGMGLFMAKKKGMDDFRARVEYEADHFREMTEDLIGKHAFSMGGEEYKRPLTNDLPEYFQPWVQRKSIFLYKKHPIGKELFDENFVRFMADEFTVMQPLYDFLVDICD